MKWEYKVENLNELSRLQKEEILLVMGRERWELVTVDDNTAYFKRSKLDFPEHQRQTVEYLAGGKVG